MAIRNDFAPGEVLAAADLNDTFGSKLNLAGGKILQIVRATDTTERSTTASSFVDVTGMSVTITPQKSDSAIFIFATFDGDASNASPTDARTFFALTDSSNNLLSGAEGLSLGGSTTFAASACVFWGYVTPATTSAVTYKLRFRVSTATTGRVRNNVNTGQMYAFEVSA
jgi:hypothetical protein